MPRGIYLHRSPSKESIEKRTKANRGKRRSLEARARMSEAQKKCGNCPPSMKGVKRSADFRQKCSARRGIKAPWYGRHHSIETRIKLSILRSREKSSNWQGGITPLTESARRTLEFKLWRDAIFSRDNWTCCKCGQRGGKLHSHHIKSFSRYPELRFDTRNGETLCGNCHKQTRNFGGKALKETIYQIMAGKGFFQLPPGREDREGAHGPQSS